MATIKTQLLTTLIEKFPDNQFKYSEIIKTLKVDVKGEDYQPTRDRGHYACNISRGGYLTCSSKKEPRFLKKLHNGKWSVAGQPVENLQKHYTTVFFILNGVIQHGDLIGTDKNGNSRVKIGTGIVPILINQKTLRCTHTDAQNDLNTLKLEKIELRRSAWKKYILELKRIENL